MKKEATDKTKVFIANLIRYAERKEVTIKSFCEDVMDIQQSSFYRWKTGRAQIQLDTAQKLVDRIGDFYGEKLEISYFL
jgi:hypothetical protein